MRDAAELTHYLTQMSLDDYGLARLRPHIAKLAELLVEQMLHAARNGRAQAQPNTAPLLGELSSLIADTMCDAEVRTCWDCGTVGCGDEMQQDRDNGLWYCENCLTGGLDECDAVRDRELEGAVA